MTEIYYEDFSLKFFLSPILGDNKPSEENVVKSFNLNKLIGKLRISSNYIKRSLKQTKENLQIKVFFFVDTDTENFKNHLKNLKDEKIIQDWKLKEEIPMCRECKITIFEVEVEEDLNITIFNFDGKKEKPNGIEHSIEGLIECCLLEDELLKSLFKCFHGRGENISDVKEEFYKHIGEQYYNRLINILHNKLIKIFRDYLKEFGNE